MKRIAILVETALNSGREILSGVTRYLHGRDDWSVFHHTGSLGAMEPASLAAWHGDGIIARLANDELLALVRAKGVPVVDVLGNVERSPYPLVKCDDRQIGTIVADHFLDAGHRHFAFLRLNDERWALERHEGFRERVEQRGFVCAAIPPHAHAGSVGSWPDAVDQATGLIAASPRPLGLMIASDQFGPIAFEACHRLRIAVPEEVSIVGVDNDLPFCNLCAPRLSSVEPNHSRVGYEAARLLDRLMAGEAVPPEPLEIAPLTLHARLSSDSTVVSDPALVLALRYIRENACGGISVDDVARHAHLSRSVLQRRFRRQLGRTVGEALLAVRLRRARDLLTLTDLPLLDVAERSGFNYQEYLVQVFQRHFKITPARFRRRERISPGGGDTGGPTPLTGARARGSRRGPA